MEIVTHIMNQAMAIFLLGLLGFGVALYFGIHFFRLAWYLRDKWENRKK